MVSSPAVVWVGQAGRWMLYQSRLRQSRGRTGEDVAKLRVAVCEMATAGPFAAARLRRSVLASRGRLRFRLLVWRKRGSPQGFRSPQTLRHQSDRPDCCCQEIFRRRRNSTRL